MAKDRLFEEEKLDVLLYDSRHDWEEVKDFIDQAVLHGQVKILEQLKSNCIVDDLMAINCKILIRTLKSEIEQKLREMGK